MNLYETNEDVLTKHTATEEARYCEIINQLETIKEKVMSDEAKVVNMLGGADGSGLGMGGSGGGLIGGLVLGSLLRNGNLLGNGNGEGGGFVTPTQLQTGLNAVIDANQNTTILQTLGDIKASVPLAEAQVQLALAGAQNDINAQITASSSNLIQGQSVINKNIYDSTAATIAGQSAVKESVLTSSAANLTATLNSKFEISNLIRDDGDKTRALLVQQNETNLNRQLTVAEQRLAEQTQAARVREVEVNVSQTMNNNQNQLQFQQQQQAQWNNILGMISNLANDIQYVRATNQAINIGSGSMIPVQSNSSTNNRVNS